MIPWPHRRIVPSAVTAAVAYAERLRWAVLPLVPGAKVPLIARAKGGQGVYDATLDVAKIVEWFRCWPNANIGIACGAASGIVVVDVDGETGRGT